jgi:hypothetical protein
MCDNHLCVYIGMNERIGAAWDSARARPGRQTTLPATIDRAARRPPPSDAAGRPIAALDGHMLLHARRSDGELYAATTWATWHD